MSSACSSGIGVSPLLGVRPLQPKLNRKRSRLSLDSNTDDNESEDGEGASRKEKSLGLLCQRYKLVNNNMESDDTFRFAATVCP